MLRSLRRLIPYLHRYRYRYAIGAGCVVLTVALRFLIPYLLGDSVDEIREDTDGGAGLRDRILFAAIAMVVAAALGATIRTASRFMILGNSRRAVHDVRSDVFDRLLRLAPSFYVRHRTGHIMSRAVNDMQNVQGLLGPVFMYLVETGVLYVVGLAFLLTAHPWLGLVGLAPFPFFLVFARRLARKVQEGSRAAQERLGELSAKVDESLSGYQVIRSLVLEAHDRERFDAACVEYSDTMLAVARVRATLTAMMTFLTALSTFAVLAVGVPIVADGGVTIGQIVSLVLYLGMLAAPTRTLGFVLSSLQRGAAALDRVGEILDMPITIDDAVDEADHRPRTGALEVRDLTVEFLPPSEQPHLSGSLPEQTVEGRRRVLDGVSFEVPAGSTVGIVGPVGAGKTTLLRALMRQIEVAPGAIHLDGVDVTRLSLDSVRELVGMAPQDAFLFGETLADNVRFGRPDADREEVLSALEVAQFTGELEKLPQGVDTLLGERGVNLSGGQRQRASLARVVLRQPAVLLLDDTLSAVDTQTGEAILAGLRPIMAQRTTLIVAHRLSAVQHADRILVLDEGRITESGTHEELLSRGGYYASVWEKQSRREDAEREFGTEGSE